MSEVRGNAKDNNGGGRAEHENAIVLRYRVHTVGEFSISESVLSVMV